jgi:hypothetical protein
LENPEPDYKGRVEGYRCSTLAECIKKHWANSREIPWKNNNHPKPPSQKKIKEVINSAAKLGELPEFLISIGRPKN